MRLANYIAAQRGRATQLASAVGVRPVMVHQWAKGIKPVPVARCMAIERATEGEVSRRDLRPDDFDHHWPDLANSQEASHAA